MAWDWYGRLSESQRTTSRSAANTDFKELYMPFDCLLFFADAGNGDQFGYPICDGVIRRDGGIRVGS
jgi:hypothetical protein